MKAVWFIVGEKRRKKSRTPGAKSQNREEKEMKEILAGRAWRLEEKEQLARILLRDLSHFSRKEREQVLFLSKEKEVRGGGVSKKDTSAFLFPKNRRKDKDR